MRYLLIAVIFFHGHFTIAQTGVVNFDFRGEYIFNDPFLPYSAYTAHFDDLDRPYMYSACLDLGLVVFQYDTTGIIDPVDTILPAAFSGLKPTNVFQKDNLLFVSLGNFTGLFPQKAGMAILNTDDPENVLLISQWDSTIFNQGCAIVIVHDNYAFLGAMEKGIIALDISDPLNPFFIDSLLPDPDFPDMPGLFSTPNARGMAMYGDDYLMLCYDHGGLRKIDVSNPYDLHETGKYMNWDLYLNAAPAYNNIVVKNNIAYVTVDYCGMDVIRLDTDTMTNVMWYNPWDCNFDNWDGNAGHTNGIVLSEDEKFVFLSGGDSEVLTFNITEPDAPVFYGQYAFPYDSTVDWSLDVNENFVSLALVDNSIFGTPYYSDKGGVQLLWWDAVYPTSLPDIVKEDMQIFPNPATQFLYIQTGEINSYFYFEIMDTGGRIMSAGYQLQHQPVETENLPAGIYCVKIITDKQVATVKTFIKL